VSVAEIDIALERLQGVVDETIRRRSRAGYFAAMYRKVTVSIRDAIVEGQFEDNDRIARFDLIFAERYLEAYDQWRQGGQPSAAWQAAFDASVKWRPIIIQQLLVGMNAHINLDLGIAAATVAPGDELPGLRADFDRINDVLADLVAGFMQDVEAVSPWVGLLDRWGGRTDQAVVKFSIEVARRRAWDLAVRLAATPSEAWQGVVGTRDLQTAGLSKTILTPGPVLPAGLLLIRIRESNDVERVIRQLGS
jgi:hypothetical protein